MRVDELAPPSALAKLSAFVDLLGRWRNVTNLISERSFQQVWERHVLDSVCLQQAFSSQRRWLDLGSGAGFPGIVLGIMLEGVEGAQIHCVESDGRKCAFLRTAAQELRLPVKVHNKRAENLDLEETGPVDAVTARAFSSLKNILTLSEDYLASGASAVLPRGKTALAEVEELDAKLYTLNVFANPAPGGGVFLQIQSRDRGL